MDELLEKFSSGLSTDFEESQKYRLSQYKSHDFPSLDQETRRNIILTHQKSVRENIIDSRRGILEVLEEVEHYEAISSRKVYKPSIYVPGFHEKHIDLSNTLMLSEWLTESPKDLSENWLILACPKGVRVLLIATKGQTRTYNKLGKQHKIWQSMLPGGNSDSGEYKKSCVLDCIWSESTQSLYVLDLLMWVNQPMTDCDMDFRDNWLKSKFSEYPSVGEISEKNNYPIYLVPKYNCDANTLQKFMMHWPPFYENNPHVDGFLFYHKEAHYIGGTTPLAGWLFPFMINEVFGSDVIVHDEYLKMKPENYTDKNSFIKVFEEKQAIKKIHIEKREKKNIFENVVFNTKLSSQSSENGENSSEVFSFVGDSNAKKQSANKKKKSRQKQNKKNKMDIELNKSTEKLNKSNVELEANMSTDIDSAVSSMEDSILDVTNEKNNDNIQNDSLIANTMDC